MIVMLGVAVVIVTVGGVVGLYAYGNMQAQQGDGEGTGPDTEADTATADDDTDADTDTDDGRNIDRPEPEFATLGAVAAGVISLVPDPNHGVRESAAALIDRPEREYSIWGTIAAKCISLLPKPLLGVRATLFKRLAIKSLHNYYKTISGSDAIAINAKAGQRLDLEPVAYRPPDECEGDESPGWYAKDRDKVWAPASEGNSVNFMGGKTPTVLLEDDDHVEAGFLAPRIGEAIELDNYRPIFTNTTLTAVAPVMGDLQPDGALADGGEIRPQDVGLEPNNPGQWGGDNLIDLNSGDEYSGMRISTAKAREWRAEHADSEAMQRAEDRGRLMEALGGEDGPGAFKLLLLAGAIILGTLFIIEALPVLLGGGGGGGGGINPLMLAGGVL